MSADTKIEWTDKTWNPVTGCTKVSPGCDHCYAEGIAHRFAGTKAFPSGFDVTLRPERLGDPLKWRKPVRVFVNSMSDLFHDDIPDDFIAQVFATMLDTPRHTYQVLTKRHGRMRSLLKSGDFRHAIWGHAETIAPSWPLPNVWLGVSVENQQWADIRIPALLDTPAAIRFLSCEPLLGPVDLINGLRDGWLTGIDWIIVGGESGRGARPMHPEWARSLRDQADAAGVAFHFKQWGEFGPGQHDTGYRKGHVGSGFYPYPGAPRETFATVSRVGKKAAGRQLDGRTWDEFPEVSQ